MFSKVEGTITVIGPEKSRFKDGVTYQYICIKNDIGQEKRIENAVAWNNLAEFISLGNEGEFYFCKNGSNKTLLGVEMSGTYYLADESINASLKSLKKKTLLLSIFTMSIAAIAFAANSALWLVAGIGFTILNTSLGAFMIKRTRRMFSDKALNNLKELGFGTSYKSI